MSSLYLALKFVDYCENSPSILMNAPSVKLFVIKNDRLMFYLCE